MKRILKNKVYLGTILTSTISFLAKVGYWSFKSKYLENQFRMSASSANYWAGITQKLIGQAESISFFGFQESLE